VDVTVTVTLSHNVAAVMPSAVTEKVQDGVERLADQNYNSTESDVRYMAYGARLRTALRAGSRYVAYVGYHLFQEAFY
jgi:Mitochondrial 18 KDa protein (MTP18)